MKTLDILGMGFRNLLRRKTRTILTVTGVVVGATAIIIMLSLGIAMEEQLDRTIASLGDLTVIRVNEWAWRPSPDGMGGESGQNHLDSALLERVRVWDGVSAVSPFLWGDAQISAGRNHAIDPPGWASIVGVDSTIIPYLGVTLASGVMPQPGDRNFALFGRRTLYQFVDTRRPVRRADRDSFWNPDFTVPPRIDVLRVDLTMRRRIWPQWNPQTGQMETPTARVTSHRLNGPIGIMAVDETRPWDQHEGNIYVDYRILQEILRETERENRVRAQDSRVGIYSGIMIKVESIPVAESIMRRLEEEEGLMLDHSLSDMRDGMQETQRATQMLLGGIGAISLLIAAIGIANTMFMSIYERTKEIGVMKVLGCPLPGIKSMFLFEASIIGFCGGIFGSGLSIAASVAMNEVDFIRTAVGNMGGTDLGMFGLQVEQGAISIIPAWLVIAAIVFSTLVGLVSGYLPARRATKISALEAIRNE